MLQLMESRGLVELEMEHQGLRIRLKKASLGPSAQVVEYVAGIPHPVSPAAPPATPAAEEGRRIIIKSPMVGTFYRAPAPDAPPFAEVGQDVAVGQVVCIIEAMKLMNEIKSEVAGQIVDILVENGAPIEFGQPLFAVEPK
ncbi:MAG: acetyl-CoA carboxylase biotin carboxyl carrier protein [Candidatus Omnitrophica bacterium]|nr:acetyl-CoA carboxylase biotin carboxyl carrier protein [Candidatus Omnitrophota bacterium]